MGATGSEIRFRTPGLWEQYRVQIVAICAALVSQAGLIAWLLKERGAATARKFNRARALPRWRT